VTAITLKPKSGKYLRQVSQQAFPSWACTRHQLDLRASRVSPQKTSNDTLGMRRMQLATGLGSPFRCTDYTSTSGDKAADLPSGGGCRQQARVAFIQGAPPLDQHTRANRLLSLKRGWECGLQLLPQTPLAQNPGVKTSSMWRRLKLFLCKRRHKRSIQR